ncbi:hypothetical protein ABVN80_11695 [Acinetobacter baumannii]
MIRRAAYKAKCITQRLSMAQKRFADNAVVKLPMDVYRLQDLTVG